MHNTTIGRLRRIGLFEGISFLVLLGVAMPLKYLAGRPEAVKVVGWIHGVLFMVYCWALFKAARQHDWPVKRMATVFVAALLPCGPFVIDPGLKREEQQQHANLPD